VSQSTMDFVSQGVIQGIPRPTRGFTGWQQILTQFPDDLRQSLDPGAGVHVRRLRIFPMANASDNPSYRNQYQSQRLKVVC
jgi:hypothetical protein